MADRPLNPTAASLLGFLHEGPMTGWTLVRVAETAIGGFWSITRSQVYRELAAMETAGLVVAGTAGARDAKPYSITDAGRAEFAAWLDREPAAPNIRYPLLLTTLFGAHLKPARLAEILHAHEQQHKQSLQHYESTTPASRYQAATLEFGKLYERAVLEWFRRLPGLLRDTP